MRFILSALAFIASILMASAVYAAGRPACPYFTTEAQDGPTQETPAQPVPTHKGLVVCNHDDSRGVVGGQSRDIRESLLKENLPLIKTSKKGMATVSGLKPGIHTFYENGRPYRQEVGQAGGFIRPIDVTGRWVMALPAGSITDATRVEVSMYGGCSNPSGGTLRTKAVGEWKPDASELADKWMKNGDRRVVISFIGCR